MAYTRPVQTEAEGGHLTAAEVNTYIVDNFPFMVPDIFTAKGDIAAATGADVAVPLAVGTDDYFLVADSGETTGLNYATPCKMIEYQTEAYSGLGSSWAKTEYASSANKYNPYSLYNEGTSRLTATTTGYYLVAMNAINVGGFLDEDETSGLAIYVDGALYSKVMRYAQATHAQTTAGLDMTYTDIIYLAAASYIEIFMYCDGSASPGGVALYWSASLLFW